MNEHSSATEDSEDTSPRTVFKPARPSKGCSCSCRADADDTMIGNIRSGRQLFAIETASASDCETAKRRAKRAATKKLGMKPKHIKCRCNGR